MDIHLKTDNMEGSYQIEVWEMILYLWCWRHQLYHRKNRQDNIGKLRNMTSILVKAKFDASALDAKVV